MLKLYNGDYQPEKLIDFLWIAFDDGTFTALFKYGVANFKLPSGHYMIRNKKTHEYWYGSYKDIKKALKE